MPKSVLLAHSLPLRASPDLRLAVAAIYEKVLLSGWNRPAEAHELGKGHTCFQNLICHAMISITVWEQLAFFNCCVILAPGKADVAFPTLAGRGQASSARHFSLRMTYTSAKLIPAYALDHISLKFETRQYERKPAKNRVLIFT